MKRIDSTRAAADSRVLLLNVTSKSCKNLSDEVSRCGKQKNKRTINIECYSWREEIRHHVWLCVHLIFLKTWSLGLTKDHVCLCVLICYQTCNATYHCTARLLWRYRWKRQLCHHIVLGESLHLFSYRLRRWKLKLFKVKDWKLKTERRLLCIFIENIDHIWTLPKISPW